MLARLIPWRAKGAIVPTADQGDEVPSVSSTHSGNNEIEIHGDQLPSMTNKQLKLQWWDMLALGISTTIGGHYFIWNVALLAGFGHFIVAYFIVASGYGMLALCMAELSSALPFAGGAYGISRVTLGTLPGFLIGCFDAYQSMFNALFCTLGLGIIISYSADIDRKWEPLWWIVIYTSYMIVHIIGGQWMWRVMRVLSYGSLLLLLIYILGSIKYADFEENAPLWYPLDLQGDEKWFQGGVRLFLKALPIPSWFFLGLESINLACHDCENPKRDVPRGYLLTFATILCTSLATIFVAASVYPGTTLLPYYLYPTAYSYKIMFACNLQRATALSFPAIYASGFGFTYYYGSQIRAMGKSGLVHPWMGYDIPGFKTPVVALLFGLLIGMLVGLRYYYLKPLPHEDLISINLLGACATYCSQFISFIVFRVYYSSIKRQFSSPLGIPGAVYGLLVFTLMFIIVAGLEKQPAIYIFIGYVGLLLIYYFLVVVKRQTFSEEEKTVLFKAYLIKSNRQRSMRMRLGLRRANYLATQTSETAADEATPVAQATRSKPGISISTPSNASTTATANNTAERHSLRTASDEHSGPSMRTGRLHSAELHSHSHDGSDRHGGSDPHDGGIQLGPIASIPEHHMSWDSSATSAEGSTRGTAEPPAAPAVPAPPNAEEEVKTSEPAAGRRRSKLADLIVDTSPDYFYP